MLWKIDIHLFGAATLDPVPNRKFKISTGEEMLAHLGASDWKSDCHVIRRQKSNGFCLRKPEMQRELARRFPENMYGCVIWMKIVKKTIEEAQGISRQEL